MRNSGGDNVEYKWDIEELEKHKRYYQYLLRGKNRTKEEKQSLKDKIDNLKEMQEIAKGGYYIAPERARIKYIDYENRLPVNTLEDYNAIHPKVKKIMIEAIQSTKDTADTYDNIELPTINLSDEELVNMSLEFADWLPDKKYKEAFCHYLNPKKHLLQFAESLDKEDMGTTYFFYHPHYRPYFLINKVGNIEDFATLNHEIAHGIFGKTDSFTRPYHNHYYLMELEGEFFDFLSLRYLKEKEQKSIIDEIEYEKIVSRYNDLMDFYIQDSAIRLYEGKRKIKLESIAKRVMKDGLEIYLEDGILLESLQQNPMDATKYVFSYLTSLDLEQIYGKDPEYALYLLESIRKNKSENIFGNLRENKITFMDDGYENLKKKVKTLDVREKTN